MPCRTSAGNDRCNSSQVTVSSIQKLCRPNQRNRKAARTSGRHREPRRNGTTASSRRRPNDGRFRHRHHDLLQLGLLRNAGLGAAARHATTEQETEQQEGDSEEHDPE